MHFMIGRIFMNQESKAINVHLEKRENKDYLVFGFEEVAEVCLNDDDMNKQSWADFVLGIKPEYTELIRYLKEKRVRKSVV